MADLKAVFSDPSFEAELERTLRPHLANNTAKALAACLSRAYDPEPRRRPAAVDVWAEEVAAALSAE